MSPILKKHARICATTLTALALWNCSGETQTENPQSILMGSSANVALNLDYTETPLLDSLVLDYYGADTLHLVHSAENKSFNFDIFPSEECVFKAKLYANGALMQEGEVTTAIEAGSAVNLKIPLHALVGFVYVKIPIGFGNPTGIKKGEMKLTSKDETFTYPMTIEDDYISFTSGELKLNREYHITISMQDESGKSIFSLEDNFTLDEKTPIPNFQIESLRSKIELAIELAKDVNVQIPLKLPAMKRAPAANDIVVSEFFIWAHAKDSSQYNFIELYNGSTDTLILDKCTFGKTSNVSGSAEIATVELPPSTAIVVGDRETTNIAGIYKYTEKMPTFGKSSGSLVLQCNGTILDSLYYGKTDSLHTSSLPVGSSSVTAPKSMQLNMGLWNKRNESDSWCTSAPTPGNITACGN